MLTTILINFVRYCGYYGYILQQGEYTIQIPQKIEDIVFYKYDKETKEAKKVLNFWPNVKESESYEFHMDTPKLEKITTHKSSNGIKPKEDFSYCNQGKALWINADSVEFSGPYYQKIDHTIKRKNQTPLCGGANYEIRESFSWDGGSHTILKWSDYLQFLDLKYKVDEKFQELRWGSENVLDAINEAIQTLENFKRDSQLLVKIWQKVDVDALVLYCFEHDKETKKGGEDNVD